MSSFDNTHKMFEEIHNKMVEENKEFEKFCNEKLKNQMVTERNITNRIVDKIAKKIEKKEAEKDLISWKQVLQGQSKYSIRVLLNDGEKKE